MYTICATHCLSIAGIVNISFDPGPTAEDINLPLEYLKQLPCGDDYLSPYYFHFNIISCDNNLALHYNPNYTIITR